MNASLPDTLHDPGVAYLFGTSMVCPRRLSLAALSFPLSMGVARLTLFILLLHYWNA